MDRLAALRNRVFTARAQGLGQRRYHVLTGFRVSGCVPMIFFQGLELTV